MNNIKSIFNFHKIVLAASMATLVVLSGCGEEDNNSTPETSNLITLDMNLPNSLTGGTFDTPIAIRAAASSNTPCAFLGADEEDPFRNGYEITKFMVSAVATWTCVADTLIDIAAFIPHDGNIYETENDTLAENYDADEPTHYSVMDDSATQVTARLYYGYDRATPPQSQDEPEFYISWNKYEGVTSGRIIINGMGIDPDNNDPEDPTMMRMDFTNTSTQQLTDMYLKFADNHEWADGFRIQVSKDLTASPLGQVFTAKGLINMTRQFIPVDGVDELPNLQMFTVSDQLGNGAAIAEFVDAAVGFDFQSSEGGHLGNYVFNKTDVYFFDDDMDWDYINKSFPSAVYRGSRNLATEGEGTWEPLNPSPNMIVEELKLPAGYFMGGACENVGDSCVELLDAIFAEGFEGQEQNQGQDPMDWRSAALANAEFLNTVFPNGVDWQGAFDMSFNP